MFYEIVLQKKPSREWGKKKHWMGETHFHKFIKDFNPEYVKENFYNSVIESPIKTG